nr:N-formyl peptide receptor 2-like [Cavia porcellus]
MEANVTSPLNVSDTMRSQSTGNTVLWILPLVILPVTFVLGVLGNGLVIWVAGFRMKRTVTTICYLNLALADFSFSVTLPFQIVSMALGQWIFGLFLCKLVYIVADINLYASVFIIGHIALDRCICVLHPIWVQNHRPVSLAKKVIAGIWILALVLTLPVFIFVKTGELDEKIRCNMFWGSTDEERRKVITVVNMVRGIIRLVIGFSMPMSMVIICYGLIAAKIHRKGMMNSSCPFRVLTAVVASFFICWFLFQLVGLLRTVWLKEPSKYNMLSPLIYPTMSLAFFNSCINPMLYVFVGRDFRKRLMHSLPTSLERALRDDSTQTIDLATNSSAPAAEVELRSV